MANRQAATEPSMVRITKGDFFDAIAAAFAAGDPHIEQKQLEAQHVHSVQLLYHAIARGAFAEMLQLTTDDFVLEILGPPHAQLVGRWQGRDEVLAALLRNFSHFDEQTPHIDAVVAQGDTVVVIAREDGKLKANGKPYDVHWVQTFTFVGDRVAKVKQIFDGGEKFGLRDLA
jgi:ketosteroid isomerase-like protein